MLQSEHISSNHISKEHSLNMPRCWWKFTTRHAGAKHYQRRVSRDTIRKIDRVIVYQ